MAALFDWRRFEPVDPLRDEARPGSWPTLETTEVAGRYGWGRTPLGAEDWRGLVEDLGEIGLDEARETDESQDAAVSQARAAFDSFQAAIERKMRDPKSKTACVFISHQRLDAWRGERVACLADSLNLNYWLDIHDPILASINSRPMPALIRSLLIAATIEIALLNSSHVIALHTRYSLHSRWVPYEFARAKAHAVVSTQAAGWFQAGQTPATCGDYVRLTVEAKSEAQVVKFLSSAAAPGAVPKTLPCHAKTQPLR